MSRDDDGEKFCPRGHFTNVEKVLRPKLGGLFERPPAWPHRIDQQWQSPPWTDRTSSPLHSRTVQEDSSIAFLPDVEEHNHDGRKGKNAGQRQYRFLLENVIVHEEPNVREESIIAQEGSGAYLPQSGKNPRFMTGHGRSGLSL